MKIARQAYAEMFGPTTGDRVRLADTELWIEVENDFTVYGEEVPDPYYGGAEHFEEALDLIEKAAKRLLDELRGHLLRVST